MVKSALPGKTLKKLQAILDKMNEWVRSMQIKICQSIPRNKLKSYMYIWVGQWNHAKIKYM